MGFPEFNNLYRVYITSSLTEVLSVIQIPKTEERRLDIFEEQFVPVMAWEFFGPEAEVLKVGDKLKLEMNHYRLLKQLGPIPQTPRADFISNWKEVEENRKQLLTQFAQGFNPSLVQQIKTEVANLSKDDEVMYRCFYNSFKMYRCREYVIELAQMLISLAEQRPFTAQTNEELINKFESLHFDQVLTKMLKEIIGCQFALTRNDPQAWHLDSKTLFSAYTLFKGAVDYMVRFCERIANQSAFFQEQSHRALTWDEAGAMEVWLGVSFLRSCGDEDHKKYSALIKNI
jgi:hypothetical protein